MRTALLLVAALLLTAPAAARDLPGDMVYLRDIAPGIAQDMRYASSDNFTGHPLPGYGAAECVLRREVAQALARVQADLAKSNFSLKMYDCYRPKRAVSAMARWAQDGNDDGTSKRFHPALDKRMLFGLGYIAAQSAHSTGNAVDLTLIKLPSTPPAPYDPAARYGSCNGPAAARAPDNSLDMGTGFDCFDPRSNTSNETISADQRRGRATLLLAMRAHGFHNYFREWWHFSYGARGPSQDFPIEAR